MQRPLAAVHEFAQQAGKYRARPLRIGIRQRRTRHFAGAEVIELAGMTLEAGLNRAQALAARKLRVEQCDELVLRRQPAHLLVGLQLVHKPIQHMPGHQLQNRVKYCIVVAHGLGSFPCLERRQTSKHRRIHAMRHVHKNQTGQPWDKPGHDGYEAFE